VALQLAASQGTGGQPHHLVVEARETFPVKAHPKPLEGQNQSPEIGAGMDFAVVAGKEEEVPGRHDFGAGRRRRTVQIF
jgi:hypothetical protein